MNDHSQSRLSYVTRLHPPITFAKYNEVARFIAFAQNIEKSCASHPFRAIFYLIVARFIVFAQYSALRHILSRTTPRERLP